MIKDIIAATLFVTGFCLLISDGTYFPLPNFIGLAILGLINYKLTK